jgi:hypothetical protein
MASTPTSPPTTTVCTQVGKVAQALFTTALSEETGLFFRSTGTQLVTRDGAIHVQVPASTVQQIQAQSGMVLRVLPTNRVEDVEKRDPVSRLQHGPLLVSLTSSESDSGGRERAYRQGQTDLSPVCTEIRAGAVRAYTTGGDGGQLVRAREDRARHGARDTHPRSHLMRAWTKEHPKGIYLRNTEGLNGEGANKTNPNTPKAGESFTPSQQDGIGQQARGHSPVIIRAETRTGEVLSAGTLGGILFIPGVLASKRRCAGTSTLGGPWVLAKGGTSILQPGARTLSEDPPSHPSVGVGGRVPYIKIVLISNVGMWVGLLNYSGNHVCS